MPAKSFMFPDLFHKPPQPQSQSFTFSQQPLRPAREDQRGWSAFPTDRAREGTLPLRGMPAKLCDGPAPSPCREANRAPAMGSRPRESAQRRATRLGAVIHQQEESR